MDCRNIHWHAPPPASLATQRSLGSILSQSTSPASLCLQCSWTCPGPLPITLVSGHGEDRTSTHTRGPWCVFSSLWDVRQEGESRLPCLCRQRRVPKLPSGASPTFLVLLSKSLSHRPAARPHRRGEPPCSSNALGGDGEWP